MLKRMKKIHLRELTEKRESYQNDNFNSTYQIFISKYSEEEKIIAVSKKLSNRTVVKL